jgi:hypothetical protein
MDPILAAVLIAFASVMKALITLAMKLVEALASKPADK